MKVISIRQPWAGLIFHGKDVENRSWATGYRGPLLIHAAKTLDREAFQFFETEEGKDLMGRNTLPEDCRTTGGVIGAVELAGCFHHSELGEEGRSKWHVWGQFGFYLREARLFDSMIVCRGHLSIYDALRGVSLQVERLLLAAQGLIEEGEEAGQGT